MPYGWLSLIPPVLVIAVATASHRLNRALITGILSAALIATSGNIINAFWLIIEGIKERILNLDTWYLYTFLIIIPSLIDLFIKTGAAAAFTQKMTEKIRTKKGIEYASFISSCVLSIDDYLSILTVGHVMRPVTDHIGIARTKLAYLIHSLSGPVVILIPISSWVAAITAYLQQAGIGMHTTDTLVGEPFSVYLGTIPFIFYSLFTIATVWLIIERRISFGPMRLHEQHATPTAIFGDEGSHKKGHVLELFIPLALLVISTILGILYMGDYWLFGGNNSLLNAFKSNTQIFLILCMASILTFVFTCVYALCKKSITLIDIPHAISTGILLMRNTLIMVFLISILSSLLRNNLKTGVYVAQLMTHTVSITFLPAILFIVSIGISIATGTSWGTFGLMLPIAVPMIATLLDLQPGTSAYQIPLLYPVIGAVLSGALCGDHISLFSETTLMAASCTQIKPLEHVITQLPYAMPVIIACLLVYLLSGFLYTYGWWWLYIIPLIIGFTICALLLLLCNRKK